jgi:hypothetical protein
VSSGITSRSSVQIGLGSSYHLERVLWIMLFVFVGEREVSVCCGSVEACAEVHCFDVCW